MSQSPLSFWVRAGAEFAPEFRTMDTNGNNSVDANEGAAAEGMTRAYGTWLLGWGGLTKALLSALGR